MMLPAVLFYVSVTSLAIAAVALMIKLVGNWLEDQARTAKTRKVSSQVANVAGLAMDITSVVGMILMILAMIAESCLGN